MSQPSSTASEFSAELPPAGSGASSRAPVHIFDKCHVFWSSWKGQGPLLVGTYRVEDHQGFFQYHPEYLSRKDALPLDPLNLPLRPEVFRAENKLRVFGVLSDAGPDRWGQYLMTHLKKRAPMNPVEFFLLGSGNGAGALLFSGSRESVREPGDLPSVESLNALSSEIEHLERKEPVSAVWAKLIEHGSSMGGARPKLAVRDEKGIEWIAKFPRHDEPLDVERLERACMRMAGLAGAVVSKTQLMPLKDKSVLLVKRFDRTEHGRLHYVSVASLFNRARIEAGDDKRSYSYMGIAQLIRKLSSEPQTDCRDLYRRMVVNTLIANTDDHTKNHGFIADVARPGFFRLSPAFDMVSNLGGTIGAHSIGIGEKGAQRGLENAYSAHERFGLNAQEALEDIQHAHAVVSRWREVLQEEGFTAEQTESLTPFFTLADAPLPELGPKARKRNKPTA